MVKGSTLGPETKSSSSSPRSAMTSTVRASPVDCSPITTHLPSLSACSVIRTRPGTCNHQGCWTPTSLAPISRLLAGAVLATQFRVRTACESD